MEEIESPFMGYGNIPVNSYQNTEVDDTESGTTYEQIDKKHKTIRIDSNPLVYTPTPLTRIVNFQIKLKQIF